MTKKLVKAAWLCALTLVSVNLSRAQGLPALVSTNFGSFSARSQTSVTNNDLGTNSSYSFVGGGLDLWGAADSGLYAFFTTNGNFDVKVRVDSLQPVHRYAKAGLMVRESLSSASRMVSLFATPTGPTDLPADQPTGEDQVEFNYRKATVSDGQNNINLGSPGYPNAWLRLARRGNIVYGMTSHDGTNWTSSASVDTSTWAGGALRPNVLLGLGSSSHDDARLVHSEFRQFSPVTQVGPVNIQQQPANNFGAANSTVSFSVAVTDPVDAEYQWLANDVVIPGATNSTYTTPALNDSFNGTRYKVKVTGRNGTVTSSEATLSVVSIDAPASPDIDYTFDDGEVPAGATAYGTAVVDPAKGASGTGGLVLAAQANNQNGSFVIDDFNFGAVVNGFTAAFKLKIGPGTSKPADGFSFSFGTNIPSGTFTAPQQGVGPGLAISFDIYDNGDLEAPAIDVFYGVDPSITPINLKGNILHKSVPLSRLVNSRYVDVVVRMNPDGKLDLSYDGEIIAYQLQTPFVPVAGGRFGFGAYAGGQNAFEGVDDIRIQTSTLSTDAYLSSIEPIGNNVSARPLITASLVDQLTTVQTNSIKLQLNGSNVTPVIARDADNPSLTTVSYQVTSLLPALTTNSLMLVWSDSSGTQHTNNGSFVVGGYVTLPAPAAPVGSGKTDDNGFKVRVFQISTNLSANSAFAEAVLAGQKGGNVADLTIADDSGFFLDPAVNSMVNYDANAAPLGFSTFPGIPGITDSKENFVAEILTYIEFPTAGFYQMGVRSDDGFILTAGNPGSAVTLGAFEGEREPANTIFGFVVPQPGVYPFRLVYYQARGGASVRWFSVDPNGQQTLINDLEQQNSLKAFRSITGGSTTPPRLTATRAGANLVITWTGGGVLESSTDLKAGSWTPVANATSPYPAPTTGNARFFRVRQ